MSYQRKLRRFARVYLVCLGIQLGAEIVAYLVEVVAGGSAHPAHGISAELWPILFSQLLMAWLYVTAFREIRSA